MSNYQSDQIKLINTSLIDPHPDNPRKQIGDVTDLAASIKANGLLSPLSVVPNGERYRVIAGHRRLAACKQAGTGAVPCFVLDLDPLQQLEAMVTENCQREQLTVLEEADAIQGMLDLGATTAAVAHRLGRSADYVRDRAKAASIKADVRKTRDDFDQLTIGQLMAIARYDGQPDRQERLAHAAGTSNFDYILHNIEVEDRRSRRCLRAPRHRHHRSQRHRGSRRDLLGFRMALLRRHLPRRGHSGRNHRRAPQAESRRGLRP